MKKMFALLLALCMMCGVMIAIGETSAWPEDGLVLGASGVKVVLPEGVSAVELTEANRQSGIIGMVNESSAGDTGGFVLIALEETEIPEDILATLATEMQTTASQAGLTVVEMYDRWQMTAMAYGDALYLRGWNNLVGETEVYYVQGDTWKGSRFLYIGLQDGEKVYWLLYSMNAEYAKRLPDLLTTCLLPVDE